MTTMIRVTGVGAVCVDATAIQPADARTARVLCLDDGTWCRHRLGACLRRRQAVQAALAARGLGGRAFVAL